MGKKKKKGMSNRLAKMSDEEKARYLQHRAAMEEEVRRRKEQLISTFMKNKMRKEEGFTRLNIAKINEYWHQILRKIAFKKMRSEILELTDWIKRVVDIKNKIIEKLMVEIDESELQYEHNFKSHLAFIDQFLDIHKHSQEHYRLDYEIKNSELFIGSMREVSEKKDKTENEFQGLKTIIYGMEVEHEKSMKVYKNRTGTFLEDFNTSFRYEHEIMVNGYIKKMDGIWKNIHSTLNEYLSNTAVKRHHYIELKHLDDRNRKEREDNERKIAKYTETLNSLKTSHESMCEDNEDELQTMIEQQKNLTEEYSRLKRQLTKDLEKDNKKFTNLTIISNQTIEVLKKIKAKGQTILQIVNFCRKYETEQEKSQSWAVQRKKWYGMYNLVEKIAQEQVEVQQAKLIEFFQEEEQLPEIPKEPIKREEKYIETKVFVTKSADSKRIKEGESTDQIPKSAPKILKTSKEPQEEDIKKIKDEYLRLKESNLEPEEQQSISYKPETSAYKEELMRLEDSVKFRTEFLQFRGDSVISRESIQSEEGIKSKEYMRAVEEYLISGDESVLSAEGSIRSTEESGRSTEEPEEVMRSTEGSIRSTEGSMRSTEGFMQFTKEFMRFTERSMRKRYVGSREGSVQSRDGSIRSREGSVRTGGASTSSRKESAESKPYKKGFLLTSSGSIPSIEGSTPSRRESIQSKEASIQSKKASIPSRKGSIQSREGPIRSREGSIRSREGFIRSREGSIHSKGAIGSREGSICSREGSICSREGSICSREGSIRSREGSMRFREGSVRSKEGSICSREGSVRSREGSVRSKAGSICSREGSIHSIEEFTPIIKGTIRSREGSVPSRKGSVRTKGESVRFMDECIETTISKEQSIVAEKVLRQMQVTGPKKRLRELKEKSRLKIEGEELRVGSREMKKESKRASKELKREFSFKIDSKFVKETFEESKGGLRESKMEREYEGGSKDDEKEMRDVEKLQETEGKEKLQETKGKKKSRVTEERDKPKETERRGESKETERRGESKETERRGESKETERRGESKEVERRGESKETERRGESKEVERRGESKEVERRGESKEVERRGESKEVERRGESKEVERRGESKEVERRGESKETEEKQISKETEGKEESKETKGEEESKETKEKEKSKETEGKEKSKDTKEYSKDSKDNEKLKVTKEKYLLKKITAIQESEDEDSKKGDDRIQGRADPEMEGNILEKYNYLNNLSDLWWMHNRVESEILDLKEERKRLIEENKIYKNIIRGILEDAVLEPPPKKISKTPKPAALKSMKMAPQLPNTVLLEF